MFLDFLKRLFFKKRKKRNLLLEAMKSEQIPCVYNDDDKKYSYIDANGGDILIAYKVDDGYKMNGEIISEAEVYEKFRALHKKKQLILSFMDDPLYEGFFDCAQMLDFFADKTNQFDVDIDVTDDGKEIFAVMKSRDETVKVLSQKEGKLKGMMGDGKASNPETIALDLFHLIYDRYQSYFDGGILDIKDADFPYKDLVAQCLIALPLVKKIDDIPNVEARITNGTDIFVMFKNGSALSHALACKLEPSGHTVIYDYSRMTTAKDNEEYPTVCRFLDLPVNVIDKPNGKKNSK